MMYLIFIVCIMNTIILINNLRESIDYYSLSYFIKSINLFMFLIADGLLLSYLILTF